MKQEIKIFNNPEFGEIRTLMIDGQPYFVGKDVAEILGYSNTKDAIAVHVDGEDKRIIQKSENTTLGIPNRGLTIINESGLYSLILSSKLPTAKKFKRWVTSEVLPSIRKHGAYMTPETLEQALLNPDTIIQLCTALKEEQQKRKKLETEVAMKNQMIAELNPKASYYDVILQTKDTVAITTIAKDYGKSAKWLNNYLHEKEVQFKQGKVWLLYQKYAEKGYTQSKTHTFEDDKGKVHSKIHTHWTQKGRLFIYDLLKKDNILPLMEREMQKAG